MRKILPAAAALLLAGCAIATNAKNESKRNHDLAFANNLHLFNVLATQLEQHYVDSIRTDEAFKQAIGAMLNTIDPYTEFYDSEDKEQLERMTSGSYGGIGAFILTRDEGTYVSEPIVGSPAQLAGMRAGDRIIRVDSTSTLSMPTDQVIRRLKGQPGTPLTVQVLRPYVADSLLTFNLVREQVVQPSVTYSGVINGNTGYIYLSSFIDKSPEEVNAALKGFKADPNVKQVILDLRGNGGGLVESAIEILGNFLPKGTEVLLTRGKTKSSEKTYKTTRTPIMPDIPLAVLIDGGSASASEITAGALQDLDRAVLIGSNSFGKGLVQGTFALPDDAMLKVTIAKYYTPSGRLIQALDYSHRNPDGTVARTPDSLTHVYKTRNGREVRDGGGLMPDSIIKWPAPSSLLYELVAGNHIFDYANKYAASHPSISGADSFTVTDSIYDDFVAHLDTLNLEPDRAGLKTLDTLKEFAKTQGYLNDTIEEQFAALEKSLTPDLHRDLSNKKQEIADFLGEEIVARYYYAAGRKAAELRNDPAIDAAIAILENRALYNSILKK